MKTTREINSRQSDSSLNIIGYVQTFTFICGQIDRFIAESEGRFLTIGKNLQKYLDRSRQLSRLASDAAASIVEEILNKGRDELNTLLNEFEFYIENTGKEIKDDREGLSLILPFVVSISDHLQGFNRIVKQLRMLGISTKIESSRLGAEDQGFFVLAETVDKLSGLINEKAKTILEKSNYLIRELKETGEKLSRLEKEQSEQYSGIKNNMAFSSNILQSKFDNNIRKAEKISSCSAGISGNINEIVTSIQFQDITRQRLEHTKSAFEELVHYANSSGDTAEEFDSSELLGRINDVILLELSQLESSSGEFNKAIDSIGESLKKIKKNVSGMLEESLKSADNDSGRSNSMKSIVSELDSITKGLNKNIEIGNKLSVSINSVISVVEDLAKYVMEIEDIGTEIELIALNARVKAARAGKNGSALGVLSETIQRLSVEAKVQTESTSKVLNNISSKSISLRANLEKGTYVKDGEKLIASTGKISDLVQNLISLESKTEKDIEKLTADVEMLKEEIVIEANELMLNGDATNLFRGIKRELESITGEISRDGNFTSELGLNTQKLTRNYTMQNEREVHMNLLRSSKKQSVLTSQAENISCGDSLGDNVELF